MGSQHRLALGAYESSDESYAVILGFSAYQCLLAATAAAAVITTADQAAVTVASTASGIL